MNTGSISEMVLNRSVVKHIAKNKKITEGGAAAGNDAALLDIREDAHLTIAEGYCDSAELPKDNDVVSGLSCLEMAYIRACNNLYAAGGKPNFISVRLTLGTKVKEGVVRKMMNDLTELTSSQGIFIIGGDTKISEAMKEDKYTAAVTAFSNTGNPCSAKILPGDRLIVAGDAGLYGAAVLRERHKETLKDKLPASYLDKIKINDRSVLSIEKAAEAAYKGGAKKVHDASFGGIYAAIYQIAEAAGLGARVKHECIPIKQETIEICERLGLNPYLLCSTGALVAAASPENAESVVNSIRANTELAVYDAGEFTKEKLKCIVSDIFPINRKLDMPDGDEIFGD
ncbi:MAG: hypothetical protein IJV21_00155 [Lachnospiraceae bacterium]|nr:hypothetical protein [Lachnospiraceae bacterium]MBR1675354.1 hypothetical protein [Eubacterium sp.]